MESRRFAFRPAFRSPSHQLPAGVIDRSPVVTKAQDSAVSYRAALLRWDVERDTGWSTALSGCALHLGTVPVTRQHGPRGCARQRNIWWRTGFYALGALFFAAGALVAWRDGLVSVKRVGGLTFVKVGRAGCSFWVSRQRAPFWVEG